MANRRPTRGGSLEALGVSVLLLLGAAGCGSDNPASNPPAGDASTVTCPDGRVACGDVCSNLTADPDHCGTCGVACNSNEVCSLGACTLACQQGLTNCDRACVSLRNDVAALVKHHPSTNHRTAVCGLRLSYG